MMNPMPMPLTKVPSEVERNSGRQVITRSMVNTKIVWEEWGKLPSSDSGNQGGSNQGGNDGDQGENPLG